MQQAAVSDLSDRADELYETQSGLEDRIQEAVRSMLTEDNQIDRFNSGLTLDEEYEIAAEKRALQTDLQTLEQDARNTIRELDSDEPRAAEEIREAIEALRETEIETRIAVAAAYIEQGEAIYVAASESAVTQGLRELRDGLQRAENATGRGRGAGRDGDPQGGLAETLAETQQLRRELQRLADGASGGGQPGDTGRDDSRPTGGVEYDNLEFTRGLERRADAVTQEVIGLFRDLRAAGATVRDIDELRRLAADIRASDFSGNADLLDDESRLALTLVEQLELALSRATRKNEVSVHTNAADEIPDEHKEIIADYYRRLGQAEDATN